MTTIIHQPYFLPWLGYFSKIPFSDKFVFLDNVHFTNGFYHNRTQYLNIFGEPKWLSIPTGQNFRVDLNKVIVNDKRYLQTFTKTIESCYAKAEFYKQEWADLKQIISDSFSNANFLIDINISLIKSILDYIEVKKPEFILSSELGNYNDKTERIISICNSVNADSILIGGGSSINEHNWKQVTESGIHVLFQDYLKLHPKYKQVRRQRLEFKKGVSILDCILNVGKLQTNKFITSDIYKPIEIQFAS